MFPRALPVFSGLSTTLPSLLLGKALQEELRWRPGAQAFIAFLSLSSPFPLPPALRISLLLPGSTAMLSGKGTWSHRGKEPGIFFLWCGIRICLMSAQKPGLRRLAPWLPAGTPPSLSTLSRAPPWNVLPLAPPAQTLSSSLNSSNLYEKLIVALLQPLQAPSHEGKLMEDAELDTLCRNAGSRQTLAARSSAQSLKIHPRWVNKQSAFIEKTLRSFCCC